MNETEREAPSPVALFLGLYPGAARPAVLCLALGAAAATLLLVGLATFLALSPSGRGALAAGALLAWGHGAGWLVTGGVARLDAVLADLSGATWLVFLATWWAPFALAWAAVGALFGA